MLAASPARTDTTASWAVPSKSPADRSAESPARWGFRRLGNDDDGAAASAAFAVTPNHAENEPSVARPRRASHRGGANDRKRSGFSDHGGCSGYVTLTEMEGPPSPPSPPEPPEPGSPSRCRSHPTRPTSRRRRRLKPTGAGPARYLYPAVTLKRFGASRISFVLPAGGAHPLPDGLRTPPSRSAAALRTNWGRAFACSARVRHWAGSSTTPPPTKLTITRCSQTRCPRRLRTPPVPSGRTDGRWLGCPRCGG